ncbi:branched-chain amino acid transport system II carrier protein [uncultured Lactobacillus sp.]|nr:branched-chain amino acid transport system II carrier protein [uncultured Lactobacillus sp.]
MQIKAITSLYGRLLPLYQDGLGWLVPVAVTFVILAIKATISKKRA